HRVETESHLHHALEREQFELFFQPVIDLNSHKLIGSEVLLRWHNRDLNNPGPAEFIYIAEECGLINPIGEWILIKACKQVVQWQQAGLPKINVAVNISARQFEDDAIVDSVVRALNQSGLPPQQLELEVTEGLLLHDTPNIRACFNKLKHMGVRISLDDFGVGYASLSYLKSYPFDILKVDRSFVQDIDTDEGSVTLIDAIINMAQTFGMKVIAEGVENLQQRRILREKNCDMVQGYLYSPPLNADQFYEWAKRYCDVQQTQHS
ncbi:MAG: EAL domain-containing protein, partial [Spongiibacter sp.]|nr:EAL domain-containing protein [Spongiibacter sp.]